MLAKSELQRCFHCTEYVTEPSVWQVMFEGEPHDVCCVGCEAIGNTIIAAGLEDYYRFRDAPAAFGQVPEALEQQLDAYAGWDAPEISERFLREREGTSTSDLRDITLAVDGLRCGACVWLLERSLRALPCVDSVQVNLATERANVCFNPKRLPLSDVIKRGAQIGFRIRPFDAVERELSEAKATRTERQRLFVAALGSMQVMMYALPAYVVPEADIETQFVHLLRWASFILTLPVILYSAWPFFKGAWRDLMLRSPGMDVPVAIGLSVAFCASVVNTIRGGGDVWFDSVSMFVFLLLGARLLESSIRRRARRTLDSLGSDMPEMAQRVTHSVNPECVETVPAIRLVPGDKIKVAAGDRVPADSQLISATGAVDLSMMTGESMPVTVTMGDDIPGGAIASSTPLTLEVTRAAKDSALSLLTALVERGAADRPQVALLADRVARVFVSALLVLVALVFLIWWQIDSSRAAEIAIATLIVSCPCALSMATPAALAAANASLLKQRLLVTRSHVLERASGITHIVFDKTGTLTEGKPQVSSVSVAEYFTRSGVFHIAKTLEQGAAHPFASAILKRANAELLLSDNIPNEEMIFAADKIQHVVGQGVCAENKHERWYLGSASWCGLDKIDIEKWRRKSANNTTSESEVWLSRVPNQAVPEVQCIARFAISDSLRAEANSVVNELQKNGFELHLFSGDNADTVADTARQLGITNALSELTPEGKRCAMQTLQSSGAKVLMVGDGLNDAPVMALSDVSLAIGQASDLARSAADAVALGAINSRQGGGLSAVTHLVHTAKTTRNIIQQNLAWAAAYNVTMIPLTAFGLIPPWGAAIGMAGSSLLVSLNALRLHMGSADRTPRYATDSADTLSPISMKAI